MRPLLTAAGVVIELWEMRQKGPCVSKNERSII